MIDVIIRKNNQTHLKLICSESIAQELSEFFTFEVPDAKFRIRAMNKKINPTNDPKKMVKWDGKIRLFSKATHQIYVGLLSYIKSFCQEREYTFELDGDFEDINFSIEDAEKFISTLNLHVNRTPYDFQTQALQWAISKRRTLILSPTGSGKSLIVYLITRYHAKKTLIIVPTLTLIHQMTSDFVEYGYDESNIHKIYTGKEKQTDVPVVISTWQSIYKMPKKWFSQFEVVIGDEAHLCQAESFKTIFSKLTDCQYRIGFTGSLSESETHKLIIEGMFGVAQKATTTTELIKRKILSEFKIKCLVLNHPEQAKRLMAGMDYQTEMDYLCLSGARNKFITNLATSLKGNTLILFQYVEKHGKPLYDVLSAKLPERKVFFVHGGVDGEERNDIRGIVETEENAIIVASYGTFSTGVNIRNLHNIIFASPSKSKVRNLQSIGRGLRLGSNKTGCVLYDIADNLVWGKKTNFTLKHFVKRVKLYNEEKFDYKIYEIELK